MREKEIDKLKEYKYGFTTDIESIKSPKGLTEETIKEYALCGVDFISIGALTHSVNSLDLSLKAF